MEIHFLRFIIFVLSTNGLSRAHEQAKMKIMLLQSIYWEGLAISLAVMLVLYYVIFSLLVKHTREEVLMLTRRTSAKKKEEDICMDEETDEDVPGVRMAYTRMDGESEERVIEKQEPEGWQPPAQEIRGLIPLMHDLAIEVRHFGEKIARAGMVREELVMGLNVILGKDVYKVLKDVEFAEFVKAMLLITVSNSCCILLYACEIEQVWGG